MDLALINNQLMFEFKEDLKIALELVDIVETQPIGTFNFEQLNAAYESLTRANANLKRFTESLSTI